MEISKTIFHKNQLICAYMIAIIVEKKASKVYQSVFY